MQIRKVFPDETSGDNMILKRSTWQFTIIRKHIVCPAKHNSLKTIKQKIESAVFKSNQL